MTENAELIGRNLKKAIREGDLARCRSLILTGAKMSVLGEDGWMPLHVAAWCGRGDAVALLLDHGADTNALTDKGRTAAFWAENKGHEDVVLEIGKVVSLRHSQRVKALKVLRDRKRNG